MCTHHDSAPKGGILDLMDGRRGGRETKENRLAGIIDYGKLGDADKSVRIIVSLLADDCEDIVSC